MPVVDFKDSAAATSMVIISQEICNQKPEFLNSYNTLDCPIIEDRRVSGSWDLMPPRTHPPQTCGLKLTGWRHLRRLCWIISIWPAHMDLQPRIGVNNPVIFSLQRSLSMFLSRALTQFHRIEPDCQFFSIWICFAALWDPSNFIHR